MLSLSLGPKLENVQVRFFFFQDLPGARSLLDKLKQFLIQTRISDGLWG